MESLAKFLHDFQLLRRAAILVASTGDDFRQWHERTVSAAKVNTWLSNAH
jgi:hypothetical protein